MKIYQVKSDVSYKDRQILQSRGRETKTGNIFLHIIIAFLAAIYILCTSGWACPYNEVISFRGVILSH